MNWKFSKIFLSVLCYFYVKWCSWSRGQSQNDLKGTVLSLSSPYHKKRRYKEKGHHKSGHFVYLIVYCERLSDNLRSFELP